MNNKTGNKLKWGRNDNIFTPTPVAKLMIDMCDIKPADKVLDGNKEKWVIKNSKELSNLIDKYLIPQELEKKITQK